MAENENPQAEKLLALAKRFVKPVRPDPRETGVSDRVFYSTAAKRQNLRASRLKGETTPFKVLALIDALREHGYEKHPGLQVFANPKRTSVTLHFQHVEPLDEVQRLWYGEAVPVTEPSVKAEEVDAYELLGQVKRFLTPVDAPFENAGTLLLRAPRRQNARSASVLHVAGEAPLEKIEDLIKYLGARRFNFEVHAVAAERPGEVHLILQPPGVRQEEVNAFWLHGVKPFHRSRRDRE